MYTNNTSLILYAIETNQLAQQAYHWFQMYSQFQVPTIHHVYGNNDLPMSPAGKEIKGILICSNYQK